MKLAYQSVVSLVWATGLFFFVRLGVLFAGMPGIVSPIAGPAIVIGLAALLAITFFSFWFGAQPGHMFRAANILMASLLSLATYREYRFNPGADLGRSWIVIAIALALVALNIRLAPRFKEEFKAKGRVDYFRRYFGD